MGTTESGGNLMKCLISCFALFVFLAGCVGNKPANPVLAYQYGDEKQSCSALRAQISDAEARMAELEIKADKSGANTGAVAVGLVLFWPALFFMDLSDDEEIELNAYGRRHENLRRIMIDKDCREIPARREIRLRKDQEQIQEMPDADIF